MPDTDWQNHPEDLDDLIPWSKTVQAECMELLFQALCYKALTKRVSHIQDILFFV